jgi:transketolase
MARVNQPSDAIPLGFLHDKAHVLRRHMMNMASRLGAGYIGQGLGIADVMAAIYFHELRYDPEDPKWPGRDRFVLSSPTVPTRVDSTCRRSTRRPASR